MPACPDCDGASINLSFVGSGDCQYCHGTGEGGMLDKIVAGLADAEVRPCSMCAGTGQCQTCGGTGEVSASECASCGSEEHASDDYPQSERGGCGSEEHATSYDNDSSYLPSSYATSHESPSTGGSSYSSSSSATSDSLPTGTSTSSSGFFWAVFIVVAILFIANREALFEGTPRPQAADVNEAQHSQREAEAQRRAHHDAEVQREAQSKAEAQRRDQERAQWKAQQEAQSRRQAQLEAGAQQREERREEPRKELTLTGELDKKLTQPMKGG